MEVTRWEVKAWGRVQHIFANRHAAVSVLEVVAGTKSSRHLHRDRSNLFSCISAEIVVELFVPRDEVDQYIPDGGFYSVVHREDKSSVLCLLKPGETLTVKPYVEHRFRVLLPGQLVEVYWCDHGCDVSLEDIVRFDEGGPDDLYELRKEMGLGD